MLAKCIIYVLLALCVLWRCVVPTVVDVSQTSLLKDFAHIVVGFGFGMAYLAKDKAMFWLAVAASLFELVFAIATK